VREMRKWTWIKWTWIRISLPRRLGPSHMGAGKRHIGSLGWNRGKSGHEKGDLNPRAEAWLNLGRRQPNDFPRLMGEMRWQIEELRVD
jgi:hypothetical protein